MLRKVLSVALGVAAAALLITGCNLGIGPTSSGCSIRNASLTFIHGNRTWVAYDMSCNSHPYHMHGSITLQYWASKARRFETIGKLALTMNMLPPPNGTPRAYGFGAPCVAHSRERLWVSIFSTWRTGPDQVKTAAPNSFGYYTRTCGKIRA